MGEAYPVIHAIRLVVHPLNVVPAVQTSGTHRGFDQSPPHHVFVGTEEVAEAPGNEAFGLRGGTAPLRRSRGTLDGADQ